MARQQFYGIKFPFTVNNNEKVFVDINDSYDKGIASQVMHVILTPKGQKLRDPEFGCDLIKFIFDPNDAITLDALKTEIKESVSRYVPSVRFDDIIMTRPEGEDHVTTVNVKYSVKKGMKEVSQGFSINL